MFLYSQWRSVPLPTRIKIATEFGISKIGPTHVRDNYVESDGYKVEDVERALNVDAIQKYTNLESTDMAVLFEAMVAKAEGRVPENEIAALVTETITINEITIEPAAEPKKRGRKPKTK